jgi:hypothetical protein
MASPAARLLASGVTDPGAVFACFGRTGRSPRVFAARDREGLLRQAQAAALKKMGITMAGAAVWGCGNYPRKAPACMDTGAHDNGRAQA